MATLVSELVDQVKSGLVTARTITLGLAAFAIAAIYVAVLSNYSQRAELQRMIGGRQELNALIADGVSTLAELREFYDGPAEADRINFASLIYCLVHGRHGNDRAIGAGRVDASGRAIRRDLLDHRSAFAWPLTRSAETLRSRLTRHRGLNVETERGWVVDRDVTVT